MPPRLTKKEVIERAQAELDAAWAAHREKPSSARTTRLRAAKGRAARLLHRREITTTERDTIMATAPPDPVYGDQS